MGIKNVCFNFSVDGETFVRYLWLYFLVTSYWNIDLLLCNNVQEKMPLTRLLTVEIPQIMSNFNTKLKQRPTYNCIPKDL